MAWVTLAQHGLTAGIALALAYAVLVLTQRHNRKAHRWLALFLLCMACMGASESLGMGARSDAALLRWQGLAAWSVAALAPALYMYIRHLLSAAPLARWQVMLHFGPALLVGLPILLFALMHGDPEFWRAHAQAGAQAGRRTSSLLSALLAVQWAGYGVAAWLLLQQYRGRLLQQYSNVDQRRMGWLGTLIGCLPALLMLWLLARLGGPDVALLIDALYVPVGVAVLATLALRQPAVLLEPIDPHLTARSPLLPLPAHPPGADGDTRPVNGALPVQPPAAGQDATAQAETDALAGGPVLAGTAAAVGPADAPAEPPAQSADDDVRWAALQARLEELLAVERPYLDSDLSLAALAQMLQTSTHHLSHVLNQRLGQNFYDLMNAHRVREVQRCLRDPAYARQSILAIALDSGFSSKATFNAAFRRHAGTTPSAYRQQGAPAD